MMSTNERLLTPPEEWLKYLMPHRTRLCITPRHLLEDPKSLAHSIYSQTYTKRKFKTLNKPFILNEEKFEVK